MYLNTENTSSNTITMIVTVAAKILCLAVRRFILYHLCSSCIFMYFAFSGDICRLEFSTNYGFNGGDFKYRFDNKMCGKQGAIRTYAYILQIGCYCSYAHDTEFCG